MGGTSADIAFIEGGAPLEVTEVTVARRPLDVPALDMTTISAGGGSIAWIDRGGFLCVGPRSAGADPGPACYGSGGDEPDRHRCRPRAAAFSIRDYFLGGTQKLDKAAAGAALDEQDRQAARHDACARPPPASAASSTCAWPTRCSVFSAKRGVDLARFHPAAVRRRRRRACRGGGAASSASAASWCRRARAPSPRSGCSAPTWCTTTSAPSCGRCDQSSRAHAEAIFRELEARAAAELKDEGLDPRQASYERELDMRYAGQGYELRVSLAGIGKRGLEPAPPCGRRAPRFDERHAEIHGHAARERPVEMVSYRLRVRVPVPKYLPAPRQRARRCRHARRSPRSRASARVFFDGSGATETTLYERDRLAARRHGCSGPAIVEQFDATTVFPPGWTARSTASAISS